MKYNIGDLFIYKSLHSKIGIITQYDDKHDLYTIEWMHLTKRWKEQMFGSNIYQELKLFKTYQHFPVK